MQDLQKFSSPAGIAKLEAARKDISTNPLDRSNDPTNYYREAKDEIAAAKRLPKETDSQKQIRSDTIKRARTKKEAALLIAKYGIENISKPDESEKEEIMNREANRFSDSFRIRRDLKTYLKKLSVYQRAIKPYSDAENLLAQAEYYTHFDELEALYAEAKATL